MKSRSAAVGSRVTARRAAAMLPASDRRSAVVTMLRMAARTAGALPVRTLLVLAEGDVADPMDAVLDRPVPADQCCKLEVVGLTGGQVGDPVDDLFACALAVEPAGVADDAEDLGGSGEVDASGRHRLDEMFGRATVAA